MSNTSIENNKVNLIISKMTNDSSHNYLSVGHLTFLTRLSLSGAWSNSVSNASRSVMLTEITVSDEEERQKNKLIKVRFYCFLLIP